MAKKKKKKAGKIGFNYPGKGEFLYDPEIFKGTDADKMLLTAIRIDMHIVKDAILRIQKYLYRK